MPKGPNGQKRPADVIGCAVAVARIATGEDEDTRLDQPAKRKSGKAGGKARADSLSREGLQGIARKQAGGGWG